MQSLDSGIIKLDIMYQDTGGNIGYSRDQYTICNVTMCHPINGQQHKWNIIYEMKPVRVLYTQQFLYSLQFVQLNTLS
jgi:hypothetical protein